MNFLSSAVMAHPARAHFVEALTPLLPGTQVVWDEHQDRWDTGRRSMLAGLPVKREHARWHLVVQDDAVLCRDFYPGVKRALSTVPDRPVAFYVGRVRPYHDFVARAVARAREAGVSWIQMQGPWWGVAVAIPTHYIAEMIEWGDGRPDIENYDRRMSRYFDSIGVRCWYSVPSLVDHRVGDGNPSLVPGRGNSASRVAYDFIGPGSPLEVEWTTEAIDAGQPASQMQGQRARRPRVPERREPPTA